ncbi:MAG: IS21 family transposase, partial [Mycobacteriales bacterium]
MELFAAVRRDARDGMSGREIECKHRVGYRTVQQALGSAWPRQRKAYPKRGSKLDPFKPLIDEILWADLDAPRKQRHTVKRIYDRLVDEHAMVGVAYQTVRDYVATRKPEILVESGRAPVQVFIPQIHRPGAEAEV